MIYVGNALQWRERGQRMIEVVEGGGDFRRHRSCDWCIGYPFTAVVLKNRQQVKKAAAEINAHVSANETLYAVNPDYQPCFST